MSVNKAGRNRRTVKMPQREQVSFPPLPARPAPKPTAEDLLNEAETLRLLKELRHRLDEKNLLRVRALVDMALQGKVPEDLKDHLSLIGRDYYKFADNGPGHEARKRRRSLQVIEGGAS